MEITKKITINLESRRITEPVDAVQCDSNTRVVEVTLRSGEEAWVPPEGVTASVAFEKPDDTSGWYDTLPTGDAACTVAGNVVRATLAPEVLTAAGRVSVAVVFMDANLNRLTTFPFILTVHKSPAAGNSISNSYYNLKTLQEINDAMAASNTKLKSAILCTEQTLDSVQQAQARQNIGAVDAGDVLELMTPLLVRIDDAGTADYSASEIISTASAVGDVFLFLSGKLVPLSCAQYDRAEFVVLSGNTKTTYVIHEDKTTEKIEETIGAGGSVTVTDDSNGNITVRAASLSISDDGNGNVTLS